MGQKNKTTRPAKHKPEEYLKPVVVQPMIPRAETLRRISKKLDVTKWLIPIDTTCDPPDPSKLPPEFKND